MTQRTIIDEHFKYVDDEQGPQDFTIDIFRTEGNCTAYILSQTQGAEHEVEAKRLARLFTDAPVMLSALKQLAEILRAGCITKTDKAELNASPTYKLISKLIERNK